MGVTRNHRFTVQPGVQPPSTTKFGEKFIQESVTFLFDCSGLCIVPIGDLMPKRDQQVCEDAARSARVPAAPSPRPSCRLPLRRRRRPVAAFSIWSLRSSHKSTPTPAPPEEKELHTLAHYAAHCYILFTQPAAKKSAKKSTKKTTEDHHEKTTKKSTGAPKSTKKKSTSRIAGRISSPRRPRMPLPRCHSGFVRVGDR